MAISPGWAAGSTSLGPPLLEGSWLVYYSILYH